MGIIRGGLLVIASVLFFIALIIGSLFLTFSYSLNYEVVKPEINSIIIELVQNNLMDYFNDNLESMQIYCQNNSEYVFANRSETYSLSCESIEQGPEAILEQEINNKVEEYYYKKYDCNFWNCFSKENMPFFLVSEKAKNYWMNKFYYVLLSLIILFISILFLTERKSNAFILGGILTIASSFIFSKLDWLVSLAAGKEFLEYIGVFFLKSSTVFWISIFTGIILLITGIILKMFSVGFKINNLFRKLNKNPTSNTTLPLKEKSSFTPKKSSKENSK